MKRNKPVIRDLLESISRYDNLGIQSQLGDIVRDHLTLVMESGFVVRTDDGGYKLTWTGHDLLDSLNEIKYPPLPSEDTWLEGATVSDAKRSPNCEWIEADVLADSPLQRKLVKWSEDPKSHVVLRFDGLPDGGEQISLASSTLVPIMIAVTEKSCTWRFVQEDES